MFFKDIFYTFASGMVQPSNVAIILVYHTISKSKVFNAVSPSMFEKQMRILYSKSFNTISLPELSRLLKRGRIPPRTVCITFDDGFMDTFTHAFPILKQFNIPATVFVETGNVGGKTENQRRLFRMMGEPELIRLHRTGLFSIEPHTIHHPRLTLISAKEIFREVKDAKDYLEQILQKKCEHFAYPYGMHDEQSRTVVQETGIKYCYTTSPGFVRPSDDRKRLNRNAINRTITPIQFEGICLWGKLL